MNILRELRRIKSKSLMKRICLTLIFSVILLINTYAWWKIDNEVEIKNLEANVTSWDVQYFVNDTEILEETVKLSIKEFFPGMLNHTEKVNIYNVGEASTSIKYEITSVKLFGKEILDELIQNNEIEYQENSVKLFTNKEKYPFDISCSFDKTRIEGNYLEQQNTNSVATMNFNASWEYEGNNKIDTEYGKKAYEYYQNNEAEDNETLEVYIKITSSRIME